MNIEIIKTKFIKYKIITEKLIKKELSDHNLNELQSLYYWCKSSREIIICVLNDIHIPPICELSYCDNIKRFENNHYTSGCCGNHKRKITNLEKFGAEHNWAKNTSSRIKCSETMLERYGSTTTLGSEILSAKVKKTIQENYGVDNLFQSEIIKEKIKTTNLEKFGVENPQQHKSIREQSIKSYLNNIDEINNTRKETLLKIYGVENINQIGKNKWFEFSKQSIEFIKKSFEEKSILELMQELEVSAFPLRQLHSKIFGKTKQLRLESSLVNYLKKILPNVEILTNTRKIISPLELDIYIPSKNLAIEFNGVYWHREKRGKDKDYHLTKTNRCLEKGIQLIHVTDVEWLFNQHAIKSLLSTTLNFSCIPESRDLVVLEISKSQAESWINKNSIIPLKNETIFYGLFDASEQVGILTLFENSHYHLSHWILLPDYNTLNNYSLLFNTFIDDYKPGFIFSLVDKKYFNGLIYKLSNFNQIKDIEPSFDIIEYEKDKFDKIWNCGYYNFLWTQENLNK